jgi:small GTP-binding protein
VLDNVEHCVQFGKTVVSLGLWDTAADSVYSRLRYPMADVFLICFSIAAPASFQNIMRKWHADVLHHKASGSCPNAKWILVATKNDLRDDPSTLQRLQERSGRGAVTTEEGIALAKQMGCEAYAETSALKGEGLKSLFASVVIVALEKEQETREGKLGQKQCLVQ